MNVEYTMLGSASVSLAGDRVLASANFSESLFWRDAKTNGRDARATQAI